MNKDLPLIHALNQDETLLAATLKALGNPVRFQMMQHLAEKQMCITAMLERARASAQRSGIANVEFRQGYAEELPVAAGEVDVIISNCVINLTEDKGRVFGEAFRALKPGGAAGGSAISSARGRSRLPSGRTPQAGGMYQRGVARSGVPGFDRSGRL